MDGERNVAKEFLSQVRLYDTQINEKLAQRDRLKDMAMSITSRWKSDSGSGGGGGQDKLGNAVAKIVDLDAEINAAVDALIDKKREVASVIDSLQNHNHISVLYKRYFDFKEWDEIAEEMGYTLRNVFMLHGRALQAVETIIRKNSLEK